MGARSLEARLTARLLGLVGALVVAVALSAVGVTRYMLDQSDSEVARSRASRALDSLRAELREGDPLHDAAEEIRGTTRPQGERIAFLHHGARDDNDGLFDRVRSSCATIEILGTEPWRACRATEGDDEVIAAIPIGSHRAAVAALARGMAMVVLVALAVMWLAIRAALRSPLREVRALVDWTAQILGTGAPEVPPGARTLEIAQLERAFDSVVRRLIDALARERASSAHIAHELRTPLTSILADLSAIHASGDSKAAIDRIRGDVARFADVIDAILVLSSDSEANARRPNTVVNLADVVRELAPAGVAVDAPDEALVDADEQLVRLAVRNLLENARRHAGGARAVKVTKEGAAARIAVSDDGPGLDESARARMFDRYWRGAADGEGRGLGLALVRAVAERHGGSARADAAREGRGMEVSFTLGDVLGWHEPSAGSLERR
jgi:signal transduction histidine kinase